MGLGGKFINYFKNCFMKKIVLFSSLLVAVMFVLVSCSKSDKAPAPGSDTTEYDVIFKNIDVTAGFQVTPPFQSKQLSEVLTYPNRDKAPYVKKAEIQFSKSYITVQGKGFETLKNVTINLREGTSADSKLIYTYDINLSALDSDGISDSTNPCIVFLNNAANYLATKKTINMQITLAAGDQPVTGVTVTMHTSAIFSW